MVNPYKTDIIISSIQKDLERINALNALNKTRESISYSNTVDLQYTLTNIWEHMIKGLDSYTGQMAPDVNSAYRLQSSIRTIN